LGEFLDEDLPNREPILGIWLREADLAMIYAKGGVGKTLATMSIALAVAGGGEFAGWEAGEPRGVLIVDGEMDAVDLQERARALMKAVGGLEVEAVRENLRLLARQHQRPGAEFPDLATEDGRQVVIDLVEEHRPALVVLDNLSTLATMDDENAAVAFDPVIALMQELKLRGSAVVLVHHAGKGGGYRGTSKIEAVFNTIVQLSHPGGAVPLGGAEFDWRWEKFRRRRDETIRPLTLKLDDEGWSVEEAIDALVDKIVEMVESEQYGSGRAIAEALGEEPMTISRVKKRAIKDGKITRGEWEYHLRRGREADEHDEY
jgi:KaiC/GvpD/RAD55 family RecA-like ATPase